MNANFQNEPVDNTKAEEEIGMTRELIAADANEQIRMNDTLQQLLSSIFMIATFPVFIDLAKRRTSWRYLSFFVSFYLQINRDSIIVSMKNRTWLDIITPGQANMA